MNVDAYLQRIGYDGPREPTLPVLRELLAAHRQAVPWENLDIPRGRPIELDEESLFAKIVTKRRGGFCHELNQLFDALLRALGFQTTLLAALSITLVDGEVWPPLSHQMLLVTLADRWLVDVGFGARGSRAPLRLDEVGEQSDDVNRFRIERGDGDRYLLSYLRDGEWRQLYDFTTERRRLSDFVERCRQQQCEPTYRDRAMCTRTIPGGNVSLNGALLVTTVHGERVERPLATEAEYRSVLREMFGIEIDDGTP